MFLNINMFSTPPPFFGGNTIKLFPVFIFVYHFNLCLKYQQYYNLIQIKNGFDLNVGCHTSNNELRL
jgi:hypothetical protein